MHANNLRSLIRVILLGSISLALVGCAGALVSLSPLGENVTLVKGFSSGEASSYKEIQTISCNKGVNARTPAENIISCRNELRNKAADLGADIVVVEEEQLGTGGGFISNGYGNTGCPNCITIVGTAYKKVK